MLEPTEPLPGNVEEEILRVLALGGAERPAALESVCARFPEHATLIREWVAEAGDGDVERIDRFVLRGEIGRGGMGVVHRAWDPALKREVALKVLHGWRSASEELRARFVRESRAIARLAHPGIVQVFEFGDDRGTPWFAMELVEGRDLRGWLVAASADAPTMLRGPTDDPARIRAVVPFVAAAADALQHAHERGVHHLDISPGNLLVDANGAPKLLDFGLARLQGEMTLTLTGSLAGTPAYVAPEMLAARRIPIDHRADVYSLGVVLYELLTRRLPFEGETTQRLYKQILMDDPPAPRRSNPAIPRDLEAVCLKAIEKDSERRYAAVAEFAADLRAWATGEPTRARPAGVLRRALRPVRRHRGVLSSLVLGLAVGLAFWWTNPPTGTASMETSDATRVATLTTLAARECVKDPWLGVALAARAREIASTAETRGELLRAALAAISFDPNSPDRLHAQPTRFPQARVSIVSGQPIEQLECSRDGRLLIARAADGSIHAWQPDEDDTPHAIDSPVGKVLEIGLSDDGHTTMLRGMASVALLGPAPDFGPILVVEAEDAVFDPAGAGSAVILDATHACRLRPDRQRVMIAEFEADQPRTLLHADWDGVVLGIDRRVEVHRLGSTTWTSVDLGGRPATAAWGLDQTRLAVVLKNGALRVFDAAMQAPEPLAAADSPESLDIPLRAELLVSPSAIRAPSRFCWHEWQKPGAYRTTSFTSDDFLSQGQMEWSRVIRPGGIWTHTGLFVGGLGATPTALADVGTRWFAGTEIGECLVWDNRYSGLLAVHDVALEAGAFATADVSGIVTHRAAVEGPLSNARFPGGLVQVVALTAGATQVVYGQHDGSFGVFDLDGRGDRSQRQFPLLATATARSGMALPEGVDLGNTTSPVWISCDREAMRVGWHTQSGANYVSRVALPLPDTIWTDDEFARDVTFHPWEDDPDPFPNVAHTFSGLDVHIEDHEVQILDRASAALVARVSTDEPIVAACTDANGRTAAVSYESLLEIRDLHGGNVLRSLRIDDPASTSDPRHSRELAITPGGTFAACLEVTEFDYRLTVFGPGSDQPLWSIDMQPLMAIWGYSTMNPLLQLGGFLFGGSHLLVYFTEVPVLIPVDVDAWAREVAFPPIPSDIARSLGLGD